MRRARSENPFGYPLHATTEVREAVCPHCRVRAPLRVMAAGGGAPIAMRAETLLACPHCRRLSIPAGLIKRVGGAALLIPFAVLLLGGLATAGYFIVAMISRGDAHGGFLFIAAILTGACSFGLWKTMRSLRRIATPGALLPLGRDARDSVHRFEGDL
jgi:hypothetical protein